MEVLMLSPLPPPAGGIATWTLKYLDQAEKNGIKVHVVNEAHIGKNKKQIIKKISIIEEIIRTTSILTQTFWNMIVHKYKIVHINSSCGSGLIRDYYSARIGKQFGAKVILYCHCNIEDQIKGNNIAKTYFSKTIALSDQVFVLNRSSYIVASRYTQNVTIIPNFIEEEIISKEHIVREKIEKVFYSGRISTDKGAKEIFEVAVKFPNIQFVMAGILDDKFNSAELPHNVILLGQIKNKEIFNYLDDADIFLFPSRTEGFSVSLLEAMARGVPCVASNVGANRDMIENKGGVILEKINSDEIVLAFSSLSTQESRKAASIWNIEKVGRYYLASIVMNLIKSKYIELLKNK